MKNPLFVGPIPKVLQFSNQTLVLILLISNLLLLEWLAFDNLMLQAWAPKKAGKTYVYGIRYSDDQFLLCALRKGFSSHHGSESPIYNACH